MDRPNFLVYVFLHGQTGFSRVSFSLWTDRLFSCKFFFMDRPEFLCTYKSVCVVCVFLYFHCVLIPEDYLQDFVA